MSAVVGLEQLQLIQSWEKRGIKVPILTTTTTSEIGHQRVHYSLILPVVVVSFCFCWEHIYWISTNIFKSFCCLLLTLTHVHALVDRLPRYDTSSFYPATVITSLSRPTQGCDASPGLTKTAMWGQLLGFSLKIVLHYKSAGSWTLCSLLLYHIVQVHNALTVDN